MKLTERKLRGIIREEISRLTENASMRTIKMISSGIDQVLADVMGGKRGFQTNVYEDEPQIFINFQDSDYSVAVSIFEADGGVKVEFGGEGVERRTVNVRDASNVARNRDFQEAVEMSMQDAMSGPAPERTYRSGGVGPYQ
jgi:hypothetical protein